MRFGIVTFPGSNCDYDCHRVLGDVLGQETVALWHKDSDLQGVDCVVLPGGFSYGDYLRCGAIARFSPIVEHVVRFAEDGGYVLGICNGFQVLTELGLLPGALLDNRDLKFVCDDAWLSRAADSPWTFRCEHVLMAPIAHHQGCYYADEATVSQLEAQGRIAFRYAGPDGTVDAAHNPNGSVANIAGVLSENKRVLGMMPHPERNAEADLGDGSGAAVFRSIITALEGGQS